MILYADGTKALVGDRVDFDGRSGVIACVIDTGVQQASWGLDRRGIMVRTDIELQVRQGSGDWVGWAHPDELVFEAMDSPCWGSVRFLGRGRDA